MYSIFIFILTMAKVAYVISAILAIIPFGMIWISVFYEISDWNWRLAEEQYFVMALSFLGLLAGYLLFKTIPNFLKKRTLKRVVPYKAEGFKPHCEMVSEIAYDSYLGFDLEKREVLYLNKKASFIDFDKLNSWRIDHENSFTTTLKLLTSIPSMPVIKVIIPKSKTDEWEANLGMVFS